MRTILLLEPLFLAIVIAVVVRVVRDRRARRTDHAARLAVVTGRIGPVFESPDGAGILGLNRGTREIALGTLATPIFLPFSAIVGVEVVKDGVSLASTDRGSQVLGAAAGDLLLGPLGLLVGGMTGSTTIRPRITDLALKVTIDDWNHPVHRIGFFHSRGGVDVHSPKIAPALQQLDKFYANVVNAIRIAQQAAV